MSAWRIRWLEDRLYALVLGEIAQALHDALSRGQQISRHL
jgi:hypothetical protein